MSPRAASSATRGAAALALAAALASCGGDEYRGIRNLASRGTTLVCFGDSLTQGVGAAPGEDYPSLLAAALPIHVVNAGVAGETTAAGLTRLERDVLSKDPRVVLIFFGGNDFLRRVPPEETRRNLEAMVERIQGAGAIVVLVGISLGLLADETGPLYEAVARDRGALYIPDALAGILSDPRLKSDQVHPNGAGYRRLADRLLARLKPLLEAADRARRRTNANKINCGTQSPGGAGCRPTASVAEEGPSGPWPMGGTTRGFPPGAGGRGGTGDRTRTFSL